MNATREQVKATLDTVRALADAIRDLGSVPSVKLYAMMTHLKPLGVGVKIEAVHSCMSCRGVMEPESSMVTTTLLGVFKKPEVRAEFLSYCNGGGK